MLKKKNLELIHIFKQSKKLLRDGKIIFHIAKRQCQVEPIASLTTNTIVKYGINPTIKLLKGEI